MPDSTSKRDGEQRAKPGSATANFRAFTLTTDRLPYRIKFDVGLTRPAADDEEIPRLRLPNYTAILDTAARRTRVSRRVVEAQGLEATAANGGPAHYLVDVYLPNMIRFSKVRVTAMPRDLEAETDCLIGMDILSCADCTLSHRGRKMMFSFRVPPLGAPDFVEEHRRVHKGRKKMVTTAATRNQLCPCGSGKRFKNCCGKIY